MIKHLVLLQFKSSLEVSEINDICKQFKALIKVIPSIKQFSYGKNCSPEKLNKGITHAFVIEFDDIPGRDAYLNHPEHIRLAQEIIIPALENGLDSALVVDYESH